jgi:hypothetical protein
MMSNENDMILHSELEDIGEQVAVAYIKGFAWNVRGTL